MINFGAFYKQYGNSQSNSNLMELLSNPTTSLIRLLDNDYFISEFKASSSEVRQYMTYKKLEELLSYVTEIGDQFDRKRSFKFPLTACQLLCCENSLVFQKLVPQKGIIIQQQKIITPVQQQFQQQVQDSDEEGEQNQDKNKRSQEPQKGEGDKEVAGEKPQYQVNSNMQGQELKQGQQSPQKKVQASQQIKVQVKKVEDEQQFGDFVQAPPKKKKIIKLKQVVDQVTINKIQYKPLINNLFSFFSKKINYTLCGYVCKILTTILNKRTTQFFTKLFQSQQTIINLLNYIQSRSVVDLIIRICTIESKQFIDERYKVYKKLAEKLALHDEIQVLSNTSAALCQVFQKINVHLKTLTPYQELKVYIYKVPQLLEIVSKNIFASERQVAIYSTPIIFELLSSFSSEPNQQSIKSTLVILLQGILQNLQRIIRQARPRIGVSGVKVIEILNLISKNKHIQSLIIQKPIIFTFLIQIIQLYPINNILHCQIFRLFNNLLIIDTENFINNILQDQKVVGWLQGQVSGELQRIKNGQRQKKCYLGHIINLCVKLRELSSSNKVILVILQKDRYVNIMKIVNDSYLKKNNSTLAGFSKDRTAKLHKIMFSKEDILASYSTFLSNSPASVFYPDEDDPSSNPALLEQLQKQLDGVNVQYQNLTAEEIKEEQHKKELMEMNQEHPSTFWKVHIEYDAEDVFSELD